MKNTFNTIDKNGITYNLLALPNTDIFKLEVLFKIGSNIEREYKRVYDKTVYGATHLLEHMSFKSTKKYDSDELLALMKKYGSRNAYTGYSDLAFHQITTTKHMDFAIEAIIGVAFNDLSRVTGKEYNSERDVVMNEIKQYGDNHQLMFELNGRTRLLDHDKYDNILGTVEILENVDLNTIMFIKNAIIHEKDHTFINITYDPAKVDDIYEVVDKVQDEIEEYVKYETPFIHNLDVDKVINDIDIYTPISPIKDESKQSLISIYLDVEANHITRYVGNIFTRELSNEESLYNIIRDKHGLTYSIEYGEYRLNDKYITKFHIDMTPGKEPLLLNLFNDILAKMPEIYTKEIHDEIIESLLLRDTLSKTNLMNYSSVIANSIKHPNEFESMKDIVVKDLNHLYEFEYSKLAKYEDVLKYLTEVGKKAKQFDYKLIRNCSINKTI